MEAVENIDLSRLQQHSPHKEFHLSLFDLMKYVSVGTSELLLYLLKETHIILECRTCSNLFRDVPYLVAHKRIYCKQRHDSDTDIQTACHGPPDDEGKASVSIKPDIYEDQKGFLQHSVDLAKKVLQSSQVSHCAKMLPNNGPTKSQFYDAVQKQLEIARDNPQPTQLFSLEPMENTQVAVKVIPSDGDDCSVEKKDENGDCTEISKVCGGASGNLCELNAESCDKLNTLPSTAPSLVSETKIGSELDKQFSKYDLADFKNCICLKCNRTMSTQKGLGDHLLTVHADELKERANSCTSSGCSNSHDQPMNGLRPKVNKTDWLKPRGYSSSEKIQNKVTTTNNSAKDILDAKKKAQANLLALKEEQLAYENEILQQKLIRGIMPKSSRGRKKFRCESCGKIFPKIESLRDHLRDCIDWEHVNQPVRNVRSPLPPSLKEGSNSFDWSDTSNDTDYKVQSSKFQNRSQTKIDNVRPRNIPPKVQPVTQVQVTEDTKLPKINGTINTIAKSVMNDSLLLANPKLSESKVLLFPLESIKTNPNISVTVKGQPQTPTVLLNHSLNKIGSTFNVIPVSICSVDNNSNSTNTTPVTSLPIIAATNINNTNTSGDFETKDVEIIAVKNSPNVPTVYQDLRTVVTSNCWTEKLKPCSGAPVLNSDNNVAGVVSRHVSNIQQCSVNLSDVNCPDTMCCKSCCNNDVEVLEHLSTAVNKSLPDASPSADSEDVIVISQSFSNSFKTEQTSNYLGTKDHMTKPSQCDNIKETDFEVSLLGFQNNSLVQVPTKEGKTLKHFSPKNSKCIKWKRYKCKLCMFSAAKRHMCKLHIRQHHLCKILTLSVKALNHYVIDLNRLIKKPTGSCRWRTEIQGKSFPSPIIKKSTRCKSFFSQKSSEFSQSRCSSSINKLSMLSLTKTKVDVKTLMDTKRQMCLKCNRTFQMMSRLEKHVACHLGWKVNHCKENLVSSNNNNNNRQKNEIYCRDSEMSEDCMFVDLTGEQVSTECTHLASCCAAVVAGSSGTCSDNHWNSNPPDVSCGGNHGQLSVLNTRKGSYQKPQVALDSKAKNLRRNMKKVNT